jgi:hypothetical protein
LKQEQPVDYGAKKFVEMKSLFDMLNAGEK